MSVIGISYNGIIAESTINDIPRISTVVVFSYLQSSTMSLKTSIIHYSIIKEIRILYSNILCYF